MRSTSFLLRNLLIVESPNKARSISGYLGKDWKVVSTYGHLSTMVSLDTVKHVGLYKWHTKPYGALERAAKECGPKDRVCIATDPDREGEVIAHEVSLILKECGTKNVERVTYNEVTKNAIKAALEKPGEINLNLVRAGTCRTMVDWWFGISASRIVKKLSDEKCISAGRVQSPALSILTDRHLEQKKFKSEESFGVSVTFKLGRTSVSAVVEHGGKRREKGGPRTELIDHINKNPTFEITETITSKEDQPLSHFDTATCLREASKELKTTVKHVSEGLQKLFELGMITYHRTDSTSISKAAEADIHSFIKGKYGEEFCAKAKTAAKVVLGTEAHEAIRPSNISVEDVVAPHSTDISLQNLYTLIRDRALKACMIPPTKETQEITLTNTASFKKGPPKAQILRTRVSEPGYFLVSQPKPDANSIFVNYNQKTAKASNVKTSRKKTSTKPNLTEADVIDRLKSLGIGRPATYASTVQKLLQREYIKPVEPRTPKASKKKDSPKNSVEDSDEKPADPPARTVAVTETGLIAHNIIKKRFHKWTDYKFTSKFEKSLDEIAHGKLTPKEFLSQFSEDISEDIAACGLYLSGSDYKFNGVHNGLNTWVKGKDCVALGDVGVRYVKRGSKGKFEVVFAPKYDFKTSPHEL